MSNLDKIAQKIEIKLAATSMQVKNYQYLNNVFVAASNLFESVKRALIDQDELELAREAKKQAHNLITQAYYYGIRTDISAKYNKTIKDLSKQLVDRLTNKKEFNKLTIITSRLNDLTTALNAYLPMDLPPQISKIQTSPSMITAPEVPRVQRPGSGPQAAHGFNR